MKPITVTDITLIKPRFTSFSKKTPPNHLVLFLKHLKIYCNNTIIPSQIYPLTEQLIVTQQFLNQSLIQITCLFLPSPL